MEGVGIGNNVTVKTAVQGQNAVTLDMLLFSQSTVVTAGLFTISAAGIDAGPISISISWQKDAVDSDIARTFTRDMGYWLRYIASSV